jgi:DNA-binding Lrp family transcriptional regulator
MSKNISRNLAFVLINTEIDAEIEVLAALRKIENVKKTYPVYGLYDIIAEVECDSMDQLKNVVSSNIKQLDKVKSTLTMMTRN